MNQEPEQSKDHVETIWTRSIFDGRHVGLLILGILFTIVWLAACVAFGLFVIIMEPLAITDGTTAAGFTGFMIHQLVGLITAAIAGILAGAAFYCRRYRKRLLAWFGGLLLAGVLIFISSFFVAGAF